MFTNGILRQENVQRRDLRITRKVKSTFFPRDYKLDLLSPAD